MVSLVVRSFKAGAASPLKPGQPAHEPPLPKDRRAVGHQLGALEGHPGQEGHTRLLRLLIKGVYALVIAQAGKLGELLFQASQQPSGEGLLLGKSGEQFLGPRQSCRERLK